MRMDSIRGFERRLDQEKHEREKHHRLQLVAAAVKQRIQQITNALRHSIGFSLRKNGDGGKNIGNGKQKIPKGPQKRFGL